MATAGLGEFSDFGGRIWLNAAHQGALPVPAAKEGYEAIEWKLSPSAMSQSRFDDVPEQLRSRLARLLGVARDEVVLTNSASYGLHLIANGYPWREGEEVLVMEGDFPSDILPWLLAEKRHGIKVVRIRPRERVVSPDELNAAITARTRLFCTTWVHSFSGYAIDVERVAEICRGHGISFVLNASQALGARQIDLSRTPVDALISVGFKWLCGPYGTGLCWLRPAFMDRLRPQKAYWLAMQTAADLGKEVVEAELKSGLGVKGFDIFGTANFFNYKPWSAALEHLLGIGLDTIGQHDKALVDRLLEGLDDRYIELLSPPASDQRRSTLVFVSHRDRSRNREIHQMLTAAGIDVAFRAGALRLSPHLYNDASDIDRALSVLNEAAAA